MGFLVLGLVVTMLPLLLRLALRLRLGIPLVYAVLAITVFRSWYLSNTAFADGIFFTLVGLVALSWGVTLVRKLQSAFDSYRNDRAYTAILRDRLREASANKATDPNHGLPVNLNGLWQDV